MLFHIVFVLFISEIGKDPDQRNYIVSNEKIEDFKGGTRKGERRYTKVAEDYQGQWQNLAKGQGAFLSTKPQSHQTTKPFCTHFFKSAYTSYFDQGESDGGSPVVMRGPWRP